MFLISESITIFITYVTKEVRKPNLSQYHQTLKFRLMMKEHRGSTMFACYYGILDTKELHKSRNTIKLE